MPTTAAPARDPTGFARSSAEWGSAIGPRVESEQLLDRVQESALTKRLDEAAHAGQTEKLEPRAPESSHEQHPNVRTDNAKLQRQRDPVLTRHLQIDDQKIKRPTVAPTHLQRRPTVVLGNNDNAVPGKESCNEGSNRRIVIHQQNCRWLWDTVVHPRSGSKDQTDARSDVFPA